jgi:hypothetical protein
MNATQVRPTGVEPTLGDDSSRRCPGPATVTAVYAEGRRHTGSPTAQEPAWQNLRAGGRR